MMHFYSTNKQSPRTSLKEAVLQGLAPDGGLFMPEEITSLPASFFENLGSLTLAEIGIEVAGHFLKGTLPSSDLKQIVEQAINFDAPVVSLSSQLFVLELFHGPSLSFKDFGARFMAQLMSYLNRHENQKLHILAATSGDTGSAVAQGFLDVPGIKVWILYPKGQVSLIQEKQLTTLGKNVTALEVMGSFDDCQALVKQAFNDKKLGSQLRLTSANSINIARLIPQSFYYFYAYAQAKKMTCDPVVISVPSGNFGNLTAGLFAKKMGLPIKKFLASTNANDSVPKFLQTGHFQSHPSKQTLSNAMDVGNPSNFARMYDLYQGSVEHFRQYMEGKSFSDSETKSAIQELKNQYNYIADPHGAVAYLGLKDYQKNCQQTAGIFLETAHPAKFLEVVEPIIQQKISIPNRLEQVLRKPKQAISISNSYTQLIEILASH